LRTWLAVLFLLLAAAPVRAIVVVSGDGAGNRTPPADDPGWDHVGYRAAGNILPIVYLGKGRVITASHVGPGDVILGGVTYPWVPGSAHPLTNADGSASDLVVFRLRTEPPLPLLPVRASTPSVGDGVVIIGRGQQRTAPTTWKGRNGYLLGTSGYMRWGTNVVEQTNVTLAGSGTRTHGFGTTFTEKGGTPDEAQAAPGDSGSAVFVRNGSTWELAGVALATRDPGGQPVGVVLFGASTLIGDLSAYKGQIDALLATTGSPRRR
jgi:hypothetical protein